MEMTDNNGKAVEIEWLKASLKEIKDIITRMDSKFENWTGVQCPSRHKDTEDKVSKVDERLRNLELKVYGMAAIITLLMNIGTKIAEKYL